MRGGGSAAKWWQASDVFGFKHNDADVDVYDEFCGICKRSGHLVCCEGGCRRAFHLDCVGLTVVPEDAYVCVDCARRTAGGHEHAGAASAAAAGAVEPPASDSVGAESENATPVAQPGQPGLSRFGAAESTAASYLRSPPLREDMSALARAVVRVCVGLHEHLQSAAPRDSVDTDADIAGNAEGGAAAEAQVHAWRARLCFLRTLQVCACVAVEPCRTAINAILEVAADEWNSAVPGKLLSRVAAQTLANDTLPVEQRSFAFLAHPFVCACVSACAALERVGVLTAWKQQVASYVATACSPEVDADVAVHLNNAFTTASVVDAARIMQCLHACDAADVDTGDAVRGFCEVIQCTRARSGAAPRPHDHAGRIAATMISCLSNFGEFMVHPSVVAAEADALRSVTGDCPVPLGELMIAICALQGPPAEGPPSKPIGKDATPVARKRRRAAAVDDDERDHDSTHSTCHAADERVTTPPPCEIAWYTRALQREPSIPYSDALDTACAHVTHSLSARTFEWSEGIDSTCAALVAAALLDARQEADRAVRRPYEGLAAQSAAPTRGHGPSPAFINDFIGETAAMAVGVRSAVYDRIRRMYAGSSGGGLAASVAPVAEGDSACSEVAHDTAFDEELRRREAEHKIKLPRSLPPAPNRGGVVAAPALGQHKTASSCSPKHALSPPATLAAQAHPMQPQHTVVVAVAQASGASSPPQQTNAAVEVVRSAEPANTTAAISRITSYAAAMDSSRLRAAGSAGASGESVPFLLPAQRMKRPAATSKASPVGQSAADDTPASTQSAAYELATAEEAPAATCMAFAKAIADRAAFCKRYGDFCAALYRGNTSPPLRSEGWAIVQLLDPERGCSVLDAPIATDGSKGVFAVDLHSLCTHVLRAGGGAKLRTEVAWAAVAAATRLRAVAPGPGVGDVVSVEMSGLVALQVFTAAVLAFETTFLKRATSRT